MILVADAAPVIFLSKINRLPLVRELFDAEMLIPSVIRAEILAGDVPPDEETLLTSFLSGCKVVTVRRPAVFATALSSADNCVLTLARREQADILLSDDRLLRRVAVLEGFRVVGTLGVLLRASRRTLLSPEIAEELLYQLVQQHGFRISTAVYEAARKAILALQSE